MPGARRFFTKQEQELLVDAITRAESRTSGEIRLHLANFCFGNEVKAAQKMFGRLGMQHTRERNGILIYIAIYSRKIAIVGDEGIHKKLEADYWQKMVGKIITRFRENKKAEVLAECIIECGEQLGKFFPGKADDTNELSNTISF